MALRKGAGTAVSAHEDVPTGDSDVRALRARVAGEDEPVDRLHPVDEELLQSLEAVLRDPSGDDRRMDARAIARCLRIRSEDLARRIVSALGGDADGSIGADAFLAGVKRLVDGGPSDRRRFAFRIHDLDGDGQIDRAELWSG